MHVRLLNLKNLKKLFLNILFNLGNMYDLLNYEEPTGILFDTDTLNIKGYKAIINCKIKNKAGQYIDKKDDSSNVFE